MSYLNPPKLTSLGTSKHGSEYALAFSFNFSDEPPDGNVQPPGYIVAAHGNLFSFDPRVVTNNIDVPPFRSLQFSAVYNQGLGFGGNMYLDGDYVINNPTTNQTIRLPQPTFLAPQGGYVNGSITTGLIPFLLLPNSLLNVYKFNEPSGAISTDSVFTCTLFTLDLFAYMALGYTPGDNL